MKINGVKKIEQKVFKNSKGDLLKFVSKKSFCGGDLLKQ